MLGPLCVTALPTLASLQASFPDYAARAALATARAEKAHLAKRRAGLPHSLRNQLDVRSVAPKEGNDSADAVLSRARGRVERGPFVRYAGRAWRVA